MTFNKEFQTFPAVHDQWHELHPRADNPGVKRAAGSADYEKKETSNA